MSLLYHNNLDSGLSPEHAAAVSGAGVQPSAPVAPDGSAADSRLARQFATENATAAARGNGAPLPAGRELDALVAERVMGWLWDPSRCRVCGWPLAREIGKGCVPDNCCVRPIPDPRADEPPRFSTDIAAAWQVVEKFTADTAGEGVGVEFLLRWSPYSNTWYAQVHDLSGKVHFAAERSESAPLTICRAAIAAVEGAR